MKECEKCGRTYNDDDCLDPNYCMDCAIEMIDGPDEDSELGEMVEWGSR